MAYRESSSLLTCDQGKWKMREEKSISFLSGYFSICSSKISGKKKENFRLA